MRIRIPASLICLTLIGLVSVAAADEVKAPESNIPGSEKGDGTFELTVTFEEEETTATSSLKAMGPLRRAAAKTKRIKEGEPNDFSAVANINGTLHAFDNPNDAMTLCEMITNIIKAARKSRITFGEIGNFPEVPPIELGPDGKPKPSPQQVMFAIQMKVKQQAQQAYARSRRPATQQQLQQWYMAEVKKAQQQGLLPQVPTQPGPQLDPKTAQIQQFRNALIPILQKSTKAGEAEKPAAEKKEAE